MVWNHVAIGTRDQYYNWILQKWGSDLYRKNVLIFFSGNIFTSSFFCRQGMDLNPLFLRFSCFWTEFLGRGWWDSRVQGFSRKSRNSLFKFLRFHTELEACHQSWYFFRAWRPSNPAPKPPARAGTIRKQRGWWDFGSRTISRISRNSFAENAGFLSSGEPGCQDFIFLCCSSTRARP